MIIRYVRQIMPRPIMNPEATYAQMKFMPTMPSGSDQISRRAFTMNSCFLWALSCKGQLHCRPTAVVVHRQALGKMLLPMAKQSTDPSLSAHRSLALVRVVLPRMQIFAGRGQRGGNVLDTTWYDYAPIPLELNSFVTVEPVQKYLAKPTTRSSV